MKKNKEKLYTKEEVLLALQYQKAECYQVAGGILLEEDYHTTDQDLLVLNYLCDDKILKIQDIDYFLNDLYNGRGDDE